MRAQKLRNAPSSVANMVIAISFGTKPGQEPHAVRAQLVFVISFANVPNTARHMWRYSVHRRSDRALHVRGLRDLVTVVWDAFGD